MNENLTNLLKYLDKKNIDAFYLPLSNENLSEFVSQNENTLYNLTGFTGDTGDILIIKNKIYLLVDGRFTIQAKNEVVDRRINIVNIYTNYGFIDFIKENYNMIKIFAFDMRLLSIDTSIKLINELIKLNIKIKFINVNNKSIKNLIFDSEQKNCESNLFILQKKYVGTSAKTKIHNTIFDIFDKYASAFNKTKKVSDIFYLTSKLEEIAYITNLRIKPYSIYSCNVLFKSFMIINTKKSILYIDNDIILNNEIIKYLKQNNIVIKNIASFYDDLKNIKYNIFLDEKINNYYIYININNKYINFIKSPLSHIMSIKNKTEIKCLKNANLLDGIMMTKLIYKIKNELDFNNNIITEYDIKNLVDNLRYEIGGKNFICPSFETIVAYKENSAICHYTPTKEKSKIIKNNSILLIDSGGNYLLGTTDITRTISLNKNNINQNIKKHYTYVLNAMLNMSMQIFKSGKTGYELDIIARLNLYNECLDFNHGTGHGIGFVTNVHEGPNRLSPTTVKSYVDNIFYDGQVISDEPGLYFENQYGIRIENDLLIKKYKKNEFGEFLNFEILTLCPYDMDLIDKNFLDRKIINYLNEYNDILYKKISPYLSKNERIWLKNETTKIII